MAAPVVTMQQLLEAGAHFGHQTHRWNPRMKPYIFGARNGIHILDLSQSVPLFARALDFVAQSVSSGGKVLFVGTKRQAQGPIADAARASGQHFVNHRWLGGMLTNWKTISNSIKKLKTLEEQLSGDTHGFTKKEILQMTRERDKLELSLGGIRDMGGIPDVMFVVDANKEELAIKDGLVSMITVRGQQLHFTKSGRLWIKCTSDDVLHCGLCLALICGKLSVNEQVAAEQAKQDSV